MFKLQPKPVFWAKVQINIAGELKPADISIEFKHLGREALKAFFEGLEGKTDAEALGEIITNWKGVDAEFDDDNFAALLDNYPSAAMSLFEAYRREALEAKAKN
jgi:uncharacterized protein YdgA (DUF945 family)